MGTNEWILSNFNISSGTISPIVVLGMHRIELYRMYATLMYSKGAEIGVFTGKNAQTMFREIPGLDLIMVDPWADYSFGSKVYGEETCERAFIDAHRNVEGYHATFMRMLSEDAAHKIPDNSLDFVYIDGDHSYDMCMLDIIVWTRKVRKDGIISGHDYYLNRRNRKEVKLAVDDYTKSHGISTWFITDIASSPRSGDGNSSWFFVKDVEKW